MTELDDIRASLAKLTAALPTDNGATFSDAIDMHLAERMPKWKPESQRLYGRFAKSLRELWGDRKLADLTRSDAVTLMSSADSRSVSRNRIVLATAIWNTAVRHELTARPCPWAGLKPPVFKPREKWLTDDELAKLWRSLDTMGWCRGTIRAIRLLILTGCRVGEICELLVSDVDFDGCAFRLRDSKTGPRVVPVSRRTIDFLRAEGVTEGPVCPRDSGELTHRSQVYICMRYASRHAGLPVVTPHQLRHSWVTNALIAGVPMEHVRRIAGHSSQFMTARYAHLTERHLQASADIVAGRFGAALGEK